MFRNNKGFSLIEVLVTVGLIGILVSIALPSYSKYKKNTLAMAIKTDVANGHKSYSAHHASEGEFCATLSQVGINVVMSSATYRGSGFYGFTGVNDDCGGTPKAADVFVVNTGYCTDKDGAVQGSLTDTTNCTAVTDNKWITVNEGAKPAADCELGADDFVLGAYSNTSKLKTMFVINAEGKTASAEQTKGSTTCASLL